MANDRPGRARRSRVGPSLSDLLGDDAILLDARADSRDDAVRLVGALLVGSGAVDPSYIDAMIEREHAVSTYVGEQVSFPHATSAAEGTVRRDAIAVARFPGGVDWNGEQVSVAIGIAAQGRGHIGILSRLASLLLEPAASEALRSAQTVAEVRALLDGAA